MKGLFAAIAGILLSCPIYADFECSRFCGIVAGAELGFVSSSVKKSGTLEVSLPLTFDTVIVTSPRITKNTFSGGFNLGLSKSMWHKFVIGAQGFAHFGVNQPQV